MKRVKNISGFNNITPHKVYDVIEVRYINREYFLIKNDIGYDQWYYTKDLLTDKILFKDVTSEYRNETISEILK